VTSAAALVDRSVAGAWLRCWAWAVAFMATTSCGGTSVVDDAITPTKDGCSSDADCGEGWCVGDAGCDAAWTCVDEIPCSAAAPFTACTCEGTWQKLAAGCPERKYAYADWSHDHEAGDPCDPTSAP
jgi:hypothetical protein